MVGRGNGRERSRRGLTLGGKVHVRLSKEGREELNNCGGEGVEVLWEVAKEKGDEEEAEKIKIRAEGQ